MTLASADALISRLPKVEYGKSVGSTVLLFNRVVSVFFFGLGAFFTLAACTPSEKSADPSPNQQLPQPVLENQKLKRVAFTSITPPGPLVFWMDDHRVTVTTRELKGVWKVRSSDYSKIIVFNVETGKISDGPGKLGNLECYSKDSMVISQPSPPDKLTADPLREFVAVGPPSQEIIWQPKFEAGTPYELSYVNCNYTKSERLLDGNPYRIVPLLPADGELLVPAEVNRRNPNTSIAYRLMREGKLITENFDLENGLPSIDSFLYLPWKNAYFDLRKKGGASSYIFRDGRRERISLPPELSTSPNMDRYAIAYPIPTKAGVVWWTKGTASGLVVSEMFLAHGDGNLTSIESFEIAEMPKVSPGGCRIFYLRAETNETSSLRNWIPTVLSVC